MVNLIDRAIATPDRLAYVIADTEFSESYAELEARSRAMAHGLRGLGLRAGDTVAFLMDNCEQFFDVYWATQRIGLYLTPINWHLGPAEVAYILENSEARLLVASAGVETAARVRDEAPASLGEFWSVGGEIPGFSALETIVRSIDAQGALEGQVPGSVMIYSSGTTGFPKGIRKPLPPTEFRDDDFAESQTRFIRLFGFRDGDRYLCPAPLYHAAPLRSCAATHCLGGTVYAMTRFDAEQALEIVERHRIEASQWVPTHFKRLLSLPDSVRAAHSLTSLRVAVHAAAPCPVPIKRRMMDWWGPILTEYYAGTEGGGTLIRSDEWLEHPGSVGRPWNGVELALFGDGDDIVTGPGEEGAIYFRDRLGAKFHYHGDEEKTRSVYRGDWFTLGDIGYRDAGGFLFLTDRQSNMIVSGGVNIYPQEAENCLMAHPKVYDVAVIGVPDEDMGEQVKGVVIPAQAQFEASALEAELIEYCRIHLAGYKVPRGIDFTDSLPRTETGKLLKRKLRDRYREIAGPAEHAHGY